MVQLAHQVLEAPDDLRQGGCRIPEIAVLARQVPMLPQQRGNDVALVVGDGGQVDPRGDGHVSTIP